MIINLIIQRLGMVCENKQKIKREIKGISHVSKW